MSVVCLIKESLNGNIGNVYVCSNPTIAENKIMSIIEEVEDEYGIDNYDIKEYGRMITLDVINKDNKETIDRWSWVIEDHEIIES